MPKSANSLKAKARSLAAVTQTTVQEVMQNYMLERILVRISKSIYCDHFVLKGGLLIASMCGTQSRTTMDMDVMIKGVQFRQEVIHRIINEILMIEDEDGIIFEITGIERIREEEEYEGYRFKIIGILENIRNYLSIDISTGDMITPHEIFYSYKMIFEDDYIRIKAYNLETILAEKYQTILDRNGAKGRMKDYYDLWFFSRSYLSKKDVSILTEAIDQTFRKRGTIEDLWKAETILMGIKESKIMEKRWHDYSLKHNYSMELSFEDVIHEVLEFSKFITQRMK